MSGPTFHEDGVMDTKPIDVGRQSYEDARDMVALGHTEELTRKFSPWSMFALCFSILGTWGTFAQDLSSGLTNGGAITILWGLVLVFICNLCVALSLGELCSAMPTALGQAFWMHSLWHTPTGRFASYICAWVNVFGWWTLNASLVAFATNFLLGIKLMYDPEWAGAGTGWVEFLVYFGIASLFTGFNLVACRNDRILPWFNNIVGIQFGALFIIFSLVLLICVGTKQGLEFQPPSFAFGAWINETGWPSGVVWFTGLVQAAYGLTAFDSVVHMIEELPNPKVNAPRAIYLSVVIGAVTGFIFMVVCLFCIQDVDTVINTPTGLPFMQLVQDAVGLKGTVVLMVLFTMNSLGQGISITTTGSRLTWSFARDNGLPFSKYIKRVNKKWKVPPQALLVQGFLITLVGLLYLFANTVLEAILSVATIALTVSYAMPILTLLIVGRDKLPAGGQFGLGRYGAVINWISVIYCAVTTVIFFFPGGPNPSGADMNYAIAVFGVMLVVAIGFWFIQGRKQYLRVDDSDQVVLEAIHLEDSYTEVPGPSHGGGKSLK
ncbi:amino acid permease family protein [Aureobasidium pullulans]|uniref:Amino acid permease family protein n=1 Tax=Aureobasidium pullulans TaxID=5580 RepID=A0A4S9NB83_AURPU|nr:amino acid permease family protein [Aureobasidium pullulans]THW36349.1 amino acid permease family protein [Aureobasidium pullulans]THY53871.1 amino acid permease family protein [Aureobasidium pullulans]THY79673.1 amino acid permease family protein [Aureobasidium pullulans]THZ15371.1 amino acid permease family protein [Aureobasidium pullulans]